MSSILKGIKQLNAVNPHNYDSDWDYQDAVANSGRSRSRYSSSHDALDDENDAYEGLHDTHWQHTLLIA